MIICQLYYVIKYITALFKEIAASSVLVITDHYLKTSLASFSKIYYLFIIYYFRIYFAPISYWEQLSHIY